MALFRIALIGSIGEIGLLTVHLFAFINWKAVFFVYFKNDNNSLKLKKIKNWTGVKKKRVKFLFYFLSAKVSIIRIVRLIC